MSVSTGKVVGVFMTYNCKSLVRKAYEELDKSGYDEIICVDDGSTDGTPEEVMKLGIAVHTHPHTGYGGNLRHGFIKALETGATCVVEIHGDGQFDASQLAEAVKQIDAGVDLVLGNRFYSYSMPLKNGMSLIRYAGNLVLSNMGRVGMGIGVKDLFTGFRVYNKSLIERLDFSNNTNGYFFSFQIIAQARFCGLTFGQVKTNCYYKKGHTSMALWGGVVEIFQTSHVIVSYWLAKMGIKTGIFKNL